MPRDSLQKLIEDELLRLAKEPAAGAGDASSLLDFLRWIDPWRALALTAPSSGQASASPAAANPLATPAAANPLATPAAGNPPATPAAVLQAESRLLVQNPGSASSTPSGGDSLAASIGHTALRLFTSGFGLVSLVSGIIGLFDGGEPAPEPLVKFALPPSLSIEAANSRAAGGLQFVDYSQEGRPRAWDGAAGALFNNDPAGQPLPLERLPAPPASPPVPLDNRFFLDHSQEIARAVREAMLNMHALNDVVSDL